LGNILKYFLMMGKMPVMYCEKGLPRPDKSGLAMTEGWIPIFMGMTERIRN